jgi:hypothetical protein
MCITPFRPQGGTVIPAVVANVTVTDWHRAVRRRWAGVEGRRSPVAAGRKFHAKLHAEVMGRQESLVAADDLDIPQVRKTGTADLVWSGLRRCVRGRCVAGTSYVCASHTDSVTAR